MSKVAVIGTGSWGTAMAGLVAPKATEVVLWGRSDDVVEGINGTHHNPVHLPGYELPANVRATRSMEEAARDADHVILATPSAYLRATSHDLAPYLDSSVPVLVLSKGMELGTHYLMHQVASCELGHEERVCALSGPNHAEEVCLGKVSAAVVASQSEGCAEDFQRLVVCPTFRAYVSQDVCGVETCGAVKNVVAIACGVGTGLDCGDNTLAVLMTRGLAEIGRVVASLGGDPMTCMGLAGMGDLVVTCTSRHSRNRTFGEAFSHGESLEAFEARTRMVVEGARACRSVRELADERGIEVPLTRAVHGILYEGVSIADAMASMLGRSPHEEFYGMGRRDG